MLNSDPKILYGVCGIGNGHTYRQLPIVEHFADKSRMVIFAFDNSYDFYSAKFKDSSNVRVVPVAVPFYVGSRDGIDWQGTLNYPANKGKDFFTLNTQAMAQAYEFIGVPDLVVSDYEMVAAQYAYAYNAPLVTIDQQSKYLCGDFPAELNGHTYADEIVRLHMFFPKAAARIACSFFKFPLRKGGDEVLVFPPVIKDLVTQMKREPATGNELLVYISSARDFVQTPAEIMRTLVGQKDAKFHVFVGKDQADAFRALAAPQVSVYEHGAAKFSDVMLTCAGIVSTAGHSLLSESMYLGIPVYAIPVSPYEQQMNAHVIDKNGFGISHPNLDGDRLAQFIADLPRFARNIKDDKDILMRGLGQKEIIDFLERL